MKNAYHNVRSIKEHRGRGTPEQEAQIDARLRELCAAEPGRPMKLREIAERTGLSHGGVFYLQSSALKKVRRALDRQGIRTHGGILV